MKAIGIDIGTTSVCGIVIDAKTGEMLKSRTENSNAFIVTENSWEKIQSVERIMKVATDIIDGFIEEDVTAIGVTGQMHGIVYINKEGKAVSPLYTWQDERGNLPYKGTTYAKHLESFSGYGNVTDFYNRENNIRPFDAECYCTIHDYFVMRLCGLKKPIIHITDSASFGKEIKCGAEITDDYKIAGKYKNIPVSVAIGDNQASVFSTIADDDNVLLNIGTGSQVSVISDTPVNAENIETRPFFDGKFLIVGSALCGGRAYSVLKDFYKEILSFVKETDDSEIYKIMNKMLENSDDSLTVDTRFAGTRSNAELRGSISGIDTNNFNPSALTKGVLTGIATELFKMYQQMNVKRSGIVGSGNGIRKNSALADVFEKMFESKMKVPCHLEEASFGAALFALVSSGVFKNSTDARKLIKYN